MSEIDEKVFAEDSADYLPVFSRYKIVLDHGEGAYAYDVDGNKYLDFSAASPSTCSATPTHRSSRPSAVRQAR